MTWVVLVNISRNPTGSRCQLSRPCFLGSSGLGSCEFDAEDRGFWLTLPGCDQIETEIEQDRLPGEILGSEDLHE